MIPKIELVVNPYTGLLEEEVWKDIAGYEGFYQVSNYGRVKSMPRVVPNGRIDKQLAGKLKKHFVDKYGYCYVMLYTNNNVIRRSVHRLVAMAFVPNPDNKPTVNHKDGVKHLNHSWEIEWATSKEQTAHALRSGLMTPFKYTDRLTPVDIRIIRETVQAGFKQKDVASYFGIDRPCVCRIMKNKIFKHESAF